MATNHFTLNDLLSHSEVREKITPRDMDHINRIFGEESLVHEEPVFIRILLGLGAWIAAFFLVFFSYELEKSSAGALVSGTIFAGLGIILSRLHRAVFLQQLALALAFAGNSLLLYGVAEKCTGLHEILPAMVMTHVGLCFLIYPLLRNPIYRFLAPIGLTILLIAWIIDKKAFDWMHILIAMEAVLTGALFLKYKIPSFLKPLAYAAAFMLVSTILFWNLMQTMNWGIWLLGADRHSRFWPSTVFLAGGLIFLYFHLSGGWRSIIKPWMVLTLCATILLGFFSTPGVLVVIGLLVLGYSLDEPVLTWLAYLFLPCFLVVFYYALNIDLAYKSYIIAGSGLVLLIVRWITGRFMPKEVLR